MAITERRGIACAELSACGCGRSGAAFVRGRGDRGGRLGVILRDRARNAKSPMEYKIIDMKVLSRVPYFPGKPIKSGELHGASIF
jgi:hypothetical protein